jgi:hypothetical protein
LNYSLSAEFGTVKWKKQALLGGDLIKSVRGEYFPFDPSIHRISAAFGTPEKDERKMIL